MLWGEAGCDTGHRVLRPRGGSCNESEHCVQ